MSAAAAHTGSTTREAGESKRANRHASVSLLARGSVAIRHLRHCQCPWQWTQRTGSTRPAVQCTGVQSAHCRIGATSGARQCTRCFRKKQRPEAGASRAKHPPSIEYTFTCIIGAKQRICAFAAYATHHRTGGQQRAAQRRVAGRRAAERLHAPPQPATRRFAKSSEA